MKRDGHESERSWRVKFYKVIDASVHFSSKDRPFYRLINYLMDDSATSTRKWLISGSHFSQFSDPNLKQKTCQEFAINQIFLKTGKSLKLISLLILFCLAFIWDEFIVIVPLLSTFYFSLVWLAQSEPLEMTTWKNQNLRRKLRKTETTLKIWENWNSNFFLRKLKKVIILKWDNCGNFVFI